MNLTYLSASEMAKMIRERKVSSREIVRAHLDRIAHINPKVNAIVQLHADRALAEAAERDATLQRSEIKGPLHGVPITLKEMIDTQGDYVTLGTTGLKHHKAETDATVAIRLRQAGAIILGKTNMPEFASGAETDNLIYGRTANPYNLAHSSGGSSGGGAAIVAAGGSALDIGNDVGGSLRIPAHYCGVATVRPTIGRIPSTGVGDAMRTGLFKLLWTEGPLTRTVSDLDLVLRILCGPDGLDLCTIPGDIGTMNAVQLKTLRIAYFTDNAVSRVTSETKATVERSARVLSDLGARVNEDTPSVISQGFSLFSDLLGARGAEGFEAALQSAGSDEASPMLLQLMDHLRPSACNLATFMNRWVQWDIYRRKVLEFMQGYDVMLCPVTARPALSHHLSMWNEEVIPEISYCWAISLTCLPSVVVRAGTSDEGLPIGVQIVARPWREDVALATAQQIETNLGGWQQAHGLE